MINLFNGDCLDQLKLLDDNSVDSVVTDPPYGLAFMGKKWDYDVPSVEIWKEVLRVLKPGGHLLSFGGTRTYHRMVINIEDAGFEIRDQIMWIYGSGFPKSMDISKAIDKQAGVERTETYIREDFAKRSNKTEQRQSQVICGEKGVYSLPSTDSAKQWQGWGTALKPANEPICLARKPISEKTVASNVLKYGAGAMNIDESRVGNSKRTPGYKNPGSEYSESGEWNERYSSVQRECDVNQGRWPANVIFDEEAGKILDEQTGELGNNFRKNGGKVGLDNKGTPFGDNSRPPILLNDSGGASRFFYCAKASKSERGKENIHPTVKPIKLMEYLCKLITPPGGVVLDPFFGSGTTGVAAINCGFNIVGIERDEEYFKIAENRVRRNE